MIPSIRIGLSSKSHLTSVAGMCSVGSCALRCGRRHRSSKAIPWVPAGTVLDYSASQKHQQLNEMQHEIDVIAGRAPRDILPTSGPVVMGEDGKFRPLTPNHPASLRGRPNFSQQAAHARTDSTPPLHSMARGHGQTFGYEEEDMSPHDELNMDRAIRDRLTNLQPDGFGPQRRGVVPPPPPPDPMAPASYVQQTPRLGRVWFGLMGGFVCTGALMVKYGR